MPSPIAHLGAGYAIYRYYKHKFPQDQRRFWKFPLQPIKELDRRTESILAEWPEQHYASFGGQSVHDHVKIVRNKTNQEPEPEVGLIYPVKDAGNQERNGNRKEKAMRGIIVISSHISKNDSGDDIQIR